MSMWLSEIFTTEELENKTKNLYKMCRSNFESLPLYFEDFFGISYKLAFGNLQPEKCMNTLLEEYYQNEYYIKNEFSRRYIKGSDYIFEYPIYDSRADIVDLNNRMHCYEIKTQYDNLNRLSKQLNDYSKIFEYISVVCSDDKYEEVKNSIPNYCGIIIYKGKKRKRFYIKKESKKSPKRNVEEIVNAMNKNDRKKYFKTSDKRTICKKYNIKQISNIYMESMLAKV